MLEKMEGRYLKTFLAVWEQRSFSKAAEQLGYVQSTVTVHISLMEEALGVKLFTRLSRGVEPTEAGIKAAAYVYQWEQLGRALEAELSSDGEPAGIVRVRLLESLCVSVLPEFLQQFLKGYPRIKLRLETGFMQDIAEAVRSRQADYGIVPRDPESDDLHFTRLMEDELLCVASPELAARIERFGWKSAGEEPVLSFGSRCMYQTAAGQVLSAAGADHIRYTEFASLDLIRQTTAAGLGIAFLPAVTVKKELLTGRLASIPLDCPVKLAYGLIERKDRYSSPAGETFKNSLISSFATFPIQ
ncbi:LysR family transcriptional regulator [Paenibacillus sambharensis]|uniref:LysR family transcriptional regulator n=1 Tax=Paenibacillus sambharensis TaxID=1803190 RepID=A0A2W1LNJ2_9BACL|nr:LysR family transcriptional regulator [Paenibacillus sambharensis]PZD96044.1 LysR family transcriptional regulator [Paenibacillus sambharensis]